MTNGAAALFILTAYREKATYFGDTPLVRVYPPWLWLVILVSALVATIGDAVVARLTDRPMITGALRQLVLGTLAAAATYGIGAAIGTSAGG